MKASELATKLRKLADALDKAPDAEINPYVSISPRKDDKETFLELAKVLPRPLTKKIRHEGTSYEDFTLEGDGFVLGIPRSKMCILVEPARPPAMSAPPSSPMRKKRRSVSSNQFPGPQNKAGSQAQLAAVYDGALPVSLGGAGDSTR